MRKEINRTIAFLLVICMLPLSSFPAKAVQVEEIQVEQTVPEMPEEQPVQEQQAVSGDTIQTEMPQKPEEKVVIGEQDTKTAETIETDMADAYLDPVIREQSIGDKSVTETWVLEEDTVVDELVFSGEKIDLNGYTLTVCEDFIFEKGYFYSNYGNLVVWGDFRMQTRVWDEEAEEYVYGESEAILDTNYSESDPTYILVAGDMYVNSMNAKSFYLNGILELKGNLYQEPSEIQSDYAIGNIHCTYSHVMILSGKGKQIIQWTGDHTQNQLGSLYIRNNSEEGIVFDGAPLVCKKIEMTKGQKVTGVLRTYYSVEFVNEYYGGDIEIDREEGSTFKNVEIDGNLILAGYLNINGNVTVNGDLIIKDRNYLNGYTSYIYISSGVSLYVKGKVDATSTTEEWSFNSNGGTAHVDGNMLADNIYISFYSDSRFEVGGNLDLTNKSYLSMGENSALVFCGNEKQELLTDSKDRISLRVVEILNTSEEGVHFNRDDIYVETINTNGNHLYLAGREVAEPFTLTEDTTLTGDYYMVGGTLDLNGYTLVINGNLEAEYTTIDINGGTLHMNGDLSFGYLGLLQMDRAQDKVYVDGKLAFLCGFWGQKTMLTDGELVVYGDFETYNELKTTKKHVTKILRKNYLDDRKQTIKIVNTSTGEEELTGKIFANLYISRKTEMYYSCAHSFEDLAEKLYYYGFPEECPSQVSGLTVSDAGYYDITLKYEEATDDVGVIGYEIYRDGTLVATTEETCYKDTGLAYHTSYEYQVYAYDEEGNKSPSAMAITASTMEDVIPPEIVQGLKVTKQTTSAIRLTWENGTDNLKVAGYNVYRDGELVKQGKISVGYTDENVEAGKVYEYQVTAVDLGGNESEKSDVVTARVDLPEILAYTPAEHTAIGGESTQLSVSFKNPRLGATQHLAIEYYNPNTKTWESICNKYIYKYVNKDEETISQTWYHSSIKEDGDIKVRYTVKDDDGNKDQQTVIYYLDRIGPTPSEIISLSEDDTDVTIIWKASESEDTKGYRLYGRKQGENYVCLANLTNTTEETYSYVHKNLEQEQTYEYYIESYDTFENVTVTETKTIIIERDLIAPTPPTEVYVRTRSGSAITIAWNGEEDNVGVVCYNVYRDGVLIAEKVSEPFYKDIGKELANGLEEFTIYNYSIEALDAAGNVSEKSVEKDAFVLMPEITGMSPNDYSTIGGEQIQIGVYFKNVGNSTGNTVTFQWREVGTQEWNIINETPIDQSRYTQSTLMAEYIWTLPDITDVQDVDIDVCARVADADGNVAERIVTYTLDQTPPQALSELRVQDNNGVALLQWDPGSDTDIIAYYLYRRTISENSYEKIAYIEDRLSGWYQDYSVETGNEYYYAISAVDKYNREGETCETKNSVVVSADISEPKISSMTPEAGRVNSVVKIKVEGTDNRKIQEISCYIRKDSNKTGEIEWEMLGTASAENNTAVILWDTTTREDGTYYVKAVAHDASGNESSNLFQRRYEVDNTGISKIKLAKCSAYASVIRLTWEDVTEEDFSYFSVEQQNGTEWDEIAKVKEKLGYDIKKLLPEKVYTFRVVGYDNLGNKGVYSDEITLITENDFVAPVIKEIMPDIKAYSKEMKLKVTASDNVALEKVVISYSLNNQDYIVLTENEFFENCMEGEVEYIWDVSNIPEGKLAVRFEVYDIAGNHNALLENNAQVEAVYEIDHTAPSKVEGVHVTETDGCVGLSWKETEETDINQYCIYRCDTSEGEYSKIKTIQTKNFYDIDVEEGATYYYKISAVDIAENEGELSEIIKVVVNPDLEKPVITGIAPVDTKILGINPTLSILAIDNAKLNSIRLEYRKKESGDNWCEIVEQPLEGREDYEKILWETTGLEENIIYEVRAVAVDKAGNYSTPVMTEYQLDLTAPQQPSLKATPGSYRIILTCDIQEESVLESTDESVAETVFYEIWRRKYGEEEYKFLATTASSEFEDTTTVPGEIYYYKAKIYDENGNCSESEVIYSHANNVDTINPVAVLGKNVTAVEGVTTAFDGTASNDNVRITSYEWDFGDGTKSVGAKPTHVYKEEGTYTATLTVKDNAGNEETTYTSVLVKDRNSGQTILRVFGSDGALVSNADVYINTDGSANGTIRERTDDNGTVTLAMGTGTYEVSVFADGYLPKKTNVNFEKGKLKSQDIYLSAGDVVVGNLSFRRMSLEEMNLAGIDLSNPDNYNRYIFSVHLSYEERPIPVVLETGEVKGGAKVPQSQNGGMSIVTASSDGRKIDLIIEEPEKEEGEIQPKAQFTFTTTQSVEWLKDMYHVQLAVLNLADSEFVLQNATASLDLPAGLSLASLTSGQSNVLQLGDIAGQQMGIASWVVKGDKPGSYDMSALFSAGLYPFNTPIVREYSSKCAVEIRSGDGLKILVQPDSAVFKGENSYVYFSLINNSGRVFYNVRATFGETDGEPEIVTMYDTETGETTEYSSSDTTYIVTDVSEDELTITKGDVYEIPSFAPGAVISGKCVIGLQPSDERHYLELIKAFTETLEGANLGVEVVIAPIRNMSAKHSMFQDANGNWYYGDPVNVATGAFIQDISALSNSDGQKYFEMRYDSVEYAQEEGQLGYGWKYDNAPYVKDEEGGIVLYQSLGEKKRYISTTEKENGKALVYGTLCAIGTGSKRTQNLTVVLGERCTPVGTYYSEEKGNKTKIEKKNENGKSYYVLTDADKTIWRFDDNGKLEKKTYTYGKEYTYTRSENMLHVSNNQNDETLTYHYSENRLIKVADSEGRNVQFVYSENGDLIEYTDEEDKTSTFVYDDNHHMIKAIAHTGEVVVENTYDENGRVLTQVEIGSDKQSLFTYEVVSDTVNKTTIKKRDGSTLIYYSDALGRVIREIDEVGREFSYAYDDWGNLTSKTYPDGTFESYEYNEFGDVISRVDTVGNEIIYEYDEQRNLISITNEDGEGGVSKYDESERLIQLTTPLGEVRKYEYNEDGTLKTETIEGLGSRHYEYDEKGNLVLKTDMLGNKTYLMYDQYGNYVETKDPLGNVSKAVYDEMGRPLESTNKLGVTTYYEYDENGNLITETIGNRETKYAYDSAGRMISMTDAQGACNNYTYDTEGNMTSVSYADGTYANYTYDKAGQLVGESLMGVSANSVAYDVNGNVRSVSENGVRAEFIRYSNGKIRRVMYSDGTSETYTYDKQWCPASVKDQDGNVTYYDYDVAGNLLKETNALGETISYTYDIYGRRTSKTDARGYTETYAYDAGGNCIQRTDAMGTAYHMAYDALGRMTEVRVDTTNGEVKTTFIYDAEGQVLAATDAEGNTVSYTYDIYGNVETVTDAKGNVIERNEYDAFDRLIYQADALGVITAYQYDNNGNVIAVTDSYRTESATEHYYAYTSDSKIIGSVDSLGGVGIKTYTDTGMLESVTDPLEGTTEYRYDKLNRVIAITNALGAKEEYAYNAQGLLASVTDPNGKKISYTYDALGRIETQSDGIGTVSYRYDANGNLLSISEKKFGEQTKSVTRTYDGLNRVTSVTDYNGNTVRYGYDELGNRISLTYPGGEIVRYTYDKCGNLLSVTEPDGNKTSYIYDPNGRMVEQSRPDGSAETYTYDKAGQLVCQKDVDAKGNLIHLFRYTYDTNGNIVEKTGESSVDVIRQAETVTMTYDADNRMVTYNEETITYDANGNMLHGPLDGQMADFTYDCRNRLVKVETENGTVTEYDYDAENVRLSEMSGNIKTVYVTDREAEYSQLLTATTYEQLLGKEVKTGQKTYFYGKGLIGSRDSNSLEQLYYHYNNIGSTTEVTSDEGAIVYRFAYDTYGELIRIENETGENLLSGTTVLSQILSGLDLRFLYNGQFGIETEDNGLYYMRARYYNPQIKRFINRDILSGDITDSQTLNRYTYVLGNPISLTDPFGLCAADYWSNAGHEVLDWLGFIIDPADGLNAAWYMAEGNYLMAGVSSIGIIPVVGSFMGKGGKEVAQEGAQKAAKDAVDEASERAAKEKAQKEALEEAEEGATKKTDGKKKDDDSDSGKGKKKTKDGKNESGDTEEYDAGSKAKTETGGSGGTSGGKGSTVSISAKVQKYVDDIVDESGKINKKKLNTLKNAVQNGTFTREEISMLCKKMAELGITEPYEAAMKTINFGKYLRKIKGAPPSKMIDPHSHHILFKTGNGASQQALVKEGQAILRKYGIDPIVGPENLVWAPNGITGQHAIGALEEVVNALKAVDAEGGDYDDIVRVLERMGRIASER